MDNLMRPDVIEGKWLEKNFDFESMLYKDMHWMFYEFVKKILIDNKWLENIKIDNDVIVLVVFFNRIIEKFLLELIGDEEINCVGLTAAIFMGDLHDKNKNIIAFMSGGLSDSKRILWEEYGADMHLHSLLFTLNKVGGAQLCKQFRQFFENYHRMQKYKF